MNPNNRFYKVLASIIDKDFLKEDINIKKQLLKKHHIALYDVIEECDIKNSSDSSIKNVKYANIDYLINNYPIRKIFLNGKKAYDLFINEFKYLKDKAILLPSTSSANAKTNLEQLIEKWNVIVDYLK